MNFMMRKSFRWAGIALAGFFIASLIFVIGARMIYQYAWTVTGNSSCIGYTFIPLVHSFESIQDAVDEVAKRYFFEDSAPKIESILYKRWVGSAKWLKSRRPDIAVTLEAYPRDEADARKITGYLSVCTVEAEKTDEWKTLAKQLEIVIFPMVHYTDARVQLDPRVFGACASKGRPYQFDTICFIHLDVPIDFDRLDAEILKPRVFNAARQK